MKLCVITLALIGLVAADVSHLEHGQTAGYSYGASESAASYSSAALAGDDSSSYQLDHLIPPYLKGEQVETESAQAVPSDASNSYQPEHLAPQHLQDTHAETEYTQAVTGDDSSSYQPEHLVPPYPKGEHVETDSAQAVPGDTSSSYQPEHLIPQHLQDTHAETESAQAVPGDASSSYQPEHLVPQHHVETVAAQESYNLGADTQTPEQFIPEPDRIAYYNYIYSQGKAVLPIPAATPQFIPGSDFRSFQPADLIPQHLRAVHQESFKLGADTQSTQQFNLGADHIEHANYGNQEQAPAVIGYTNTIAPANLYQEPTSNGIEEFNQETRVPVVSVGHNTISPAHLETKYSNGASSSASSFGSANSNYGTQYASNGGYVY